MVLSWIYRRMRTGRPQKDQKRKLVISVQVTEDEKEIVQAAAERRGYTMSAFLRFIGLQAAESDNGRDHPVP